jgi:tetratricopeptide (TPR) repeat protein
MDKPSALALLRKKLGSQVDSSEIVELAAVLEYMPLAIVQAAAYISQRLPRYSVARYLDEYKKSERKRTSLLNYDKGQLRRDWEARNSIIVTWQISFEHIRQTRRSATDLLSLMSFFDRQGIPEEVLRDQGKQEDSNSNQQGKKAEDVGIDEDDDRSQSSVSDESEDDAFEDDVVALRSFCFISDETDSTTFEMHALVQLATRTWLAANGELERWKQQFVSSLSAAFPTGEYENWAVCQKLFVHAKMAVAQKPEDKSSLVEWATLLYRAAWYAWQRGNAVDSERLALESMKAQQKVLGEEHRDTLSSMGMVGLARSLGGRWREAAEIEVKKMNASKTVLGPDHPNTLSSMANLAMTYSNQGRWEDAEMLQVEVLKTSKTKLGADHPDTLNSMANLTSTYWNQGQWKDAEKLEVDVMKTSKTKLGADHPDTLSSIANLASTYRNQGRWKDAEKLDVEVLETSKTKLGADHPSTLTSMASLASTYRSQGRWKDAEKLDVEVLEARKTKLGADHPSTLTSMANLALTYESQGRWKDAEKLDVEVLEARKTKLGADHPQTLTSMHNLAFTWRSLGWSAEAIALMQQCVQQRQQVLGDDHPDLVSSLQVLEQWEAKEAEAEVGCEVEGTLLTQGHKHD